MINLAVKDKGNNANREENQIDDNRGRIEMEFVTHSRLGVKSLELINSASSDRSSSARISSRTIAGADDVVLFQVKSTHLRLVDGATVVAAGRGSCESLNLSFLPLFVGGNNAHRVASFNLLNILPSDYMAGERVDDLNAFVVKDDRGMKKDLEEKGADKNTPDCCNHSAGQAVIKEINVDKQADKEKAQEGKNIGARRAEELAIVHEEIFSRAREMRVA